MKLKPLHPLAALVAGCLCLDAAWAQPQASVLRVRAKSDIRSTDPGINRDGPTDAVMAHIVEGLVAYREDTSVVPMLAESISVSPDGLVYTFKLRRGVTFHNGATLTADDVVFSWNRYMQPSNNWRCLAEFDGRGVAKVVGVQAVDPSTVAYTLEKPTALFLTTLARTDCGMAGVYHRSSLDADGKWKEPVGTGPFKLGEWRRGQFFDLVRHDQYAALPGKRDGLAGNKTALVPRVRFIVIPDSSAGKAALIAGNVDIDYDTSTEDLAELKGRKEFSLHAWPSMYINGLLMQTRDPLLKDVRIRRALALALDLPELVATVTTGTAKPSRSIVPVPSSYYKAPQGVLPKRDIAQAKRLLAEAGYKGQPIKLLTTKRYESVYNVALMSQAMAQEAGIKVDVEVLEWATLLDRYNKGDYQAMSFSYSARLDPSLSFEMITGPKDKQPRKVWEDTEAIELIAKSNVTADRAQRQAIFDRLEAKLRQDVPGVFMYSSVTTSVARKHVVGYESWVSGEPRMWGVSLAATKP